MKLTIWNWKLTSFIKVASMSEQVILFCKQQPSAWKKLKLSKKFARKFEQSQKYEQLRFNMNSW
jgi:hypothetical protein